MSSVLEVTVIGGSGLKDKELFTRQDPYVEVNYCGQRFRSKTDIDGGTNPAFNATFHLNINHGSHEFSVVIINENVLKDNVIGSTRVNFQRVLSAGFDDSHWPVYTSRQKQRGSLHIIMKYPAGMGSTYHGAAYPPPMPYAQPAPYTPSYAPPPPSYPPAYYPTPAPAYSPHPPPAQPYPPPAQPYPQPYPPQQGPYYNQY